MRHCFVVRLRHSLLVVLGALGTAFVTSAVSHAAIISTPSMPGACTIGHNDYGSVSVTGGQIFGNVIVGLLPGAIVQLGNIPGNAGSYVELECDGINVAAGNTFNIRSGADFQRVILRNSDTDPSVIEGALHALPGGLMFKDAGIEGAAGAWAAPYLEFINDNGITVALNGLVNGPGGLLVSGLSGWQVGEALINAGTINGGPHLELRGRKIQGGGIYMGDEIVISTLTVANNPVNGAHFLSNSLQLHPSSNGPVSLTLHAYGTAPQVLNIKINGDGSVWMPSSWGPGSTTPPNNAVIPQGGTRAAGVPEPAYGGGSMIVQATGSLEVINGPTHDFVFPGAIALKALGTLNLNAVVINQGWTISGQQFQGVFFESPSIVSPAGNIQVLTNHPNWINFSTYPTQRVRTWSLTQQQNGSAAYATADSFAPHQNTYSTSVEAAANGQCWTCLINFQPIVVF